MNRLTNGKNRNRKRKVQSRVNKNVQKIETKNQSVRKKSSKKKYNSRKPSLGLRLRKNAAVLMLIMIMLVLIFMNRNNISAYFTNLKTVSNLFSIDAYYTVTFDANTGSGTMDDQTISYNVSTPLNSNEFSKDGFDFKEWNTKADGSGESYLNTQEVENLGDITLYAQWSKASVKYAVQIYGINQDEDLAGNKLGLTFGPALASEFKDKYITHRYEETAVGSGVFNVITVVHNIAADGTETTEEIVLKNAQGNNVTRTTEEKNKYNINLHNMTWTEIAEVQDKTVFLDCMLCGDTKSVSICLNDEIGSGQLFDQPGDGTGTLYEALEPYYRSWNPSYNGTEFPERNNEAAIYGGTKGSNAKNAGGYSSSHIRATLIGVNSKTDETYAGNVNLNADNSLFSCIEEDLRRVITPKKVKYVTGTDPYNYILNEDIADPIWIFSAREIYGYPDLQGNTSEGLGTSGDGYQKFGHDESLYRIGTYGPNDTMFRSNYTENGTKYHWWNRSLFLNNEDVGLVTENGHLYYEPAHCTLHGSIAFGFCITSIPVNYTIRYNANTGSGEMADQYMQSNIAAPLTPNAFTKDGYVFKGWNTAPDGSGTAFKDKQVVSNLSTTNGEIIDLYAQWKIKPIKYAVQIYGIKDDGDELGQPLGLTFGPATGDNYNNKYVTHRYEETSSGSGVYNVIIVTHTVAEDGTETTTEATLQNSVGADVTRTAQEMNRYNKNIHDMTWQEIAAVENKEDFLDCMLCGDTKAVEITLNSELDKGNSYTQNGDGAGFLENSINSQYIRWNPTSTDEPNATNSDPQTGTNGRNAGGYSSSHMRATLIGFNDKTDITYAGSTNLTASNSLYSCIDEELTSVITSKKIKYVTGGYKDGEYSLNEDIADKIWLFSSRELGGVSNYGGKGTEGIGNDGVAYGKFRNLDSRFYITPFDSGRTEKRACFREDDLNNYYWWLRTPYLISSYNVSEVGGSGTISYGWSGSGNGIAFGFCIDEVPLNYIIRFNANSGTGTMPDQHMKTNEPADLILNTFTKEEYEFTGWNTEPDGSGASFADGAWIYRIGDYEGQVINLYAQWRRSGDPKKGDYVAYHPVASSINSSYTDFQPGQVGYTASNHTYHITDSYLGLSSGDTFEHNNEFTQENLRWRIWDIDSQTVRLVPEGTTSQKLGIKNTVGFNNGLFLMNDICSKLYAGEVDGITAKSLTYKDIEEKAILNYAATHSNSSGYVNNAGKPIWSEANIRTIFGLENTYGQGYILERTNSTTRRFLPAIFANETFNKTTTDTTSTIYLQILDMENDYANGSTIDPPTSASYWQGPDSASPGTSRPMSFKQTYYTVDESPATYLDSIDRSLVFTGNNYWVASRSLRYTNSSSPYFQFYVRMVSNRNTLTQYVLSATNNQTGVTGSTIGTDGYGLRLRPIVTIDRSKFGFEDGGEEWNLVSH